MGMEEILNQSLSFKKKGLGEPQRKKVKYYSGGVRRNLKLGEHQTDAPKCVKFSFPRFGQMSIIAAVFIVIGLILLKNLLGIYATLEEKRMQEANIVSKNLGNIKGEYGNMAAMPSLNSSVMEYLYNFTDLIRGDMDASILYLYVFSNASAQRYSVTLGNFMKGRINATVNATGTTYEFGVMSDKRNSTTDFSFTADGTVNVTLQYAINGANVTEEFRVPVSTTRNSAFGFFDIQLTVADITVRSKEIFNRSWA